MDCYENVNNVSQTYLPTLPTVRHHTEGGVWLAETGSILEEMHYNGSFNAVYPSAKEVEWEEYFFHFVHLSIHLKTKPCPLCEYLPQ